jgi:hypothetical protein
MARIENEASSNSSIVAGAFVVAVKFFTQSLLSNGIGDTFYRAFA